MSPVRSSSVQATAIARVGRAAHRYFSQKDQAREQAYHTSREAIRSAATTIRAIHRHDATEARKQLKATTDAIAKFEPLLRKHQDLYYSGFVQDAQKEYSEAACVLAMIEGEALPTPDGLKVAYAPYLNGLGETVGELRRYILDSLRKDDISRCEELMDTMDEVYTILVTMDYPEAVTGGLRRTADMVRGILERTRGDLTMALRQRNLEQRLAARRRAAADGVVPQERRTTTRTHRTEHPVPQESQPASETELQPYVEKARASVAREFQAIRTAILGLGADIQEVPEKGGRIVYRRLGVAGRRGWQNFCALHPERKQIKVWLGPEKKWEGYNVHRDRHYAWYRFRPRRGQGTRRELLDMVRRAYDLGERNGTGTAA